MSEIGREARGKKIDVTCVHCRRKFQLPAEVLFDGGSKRCPHCGLDHQSDGSGGKQFDKTINDFRKSMERMNRGRR